MDTPRPQPPFRGTLRSGGLGKQDPRQRAKEDQVLSRVSRAVTLAVKVIGPALPALVIVIVGAKRW